MKRVMLFGLLCVLVLGPAGCAPAEEPVAEPAEPDEASPPPSTSAPTFELTEVAISEELPDFTSRNVTVLGVQVGDITNNVAGNLGEQFGETVVGAQDYLTVYHAGGIVLYTFRQTGVARRIEVTTQMADEVVDPNLQAWLEDGQQAVLRQWLGPEERLQNIPENNNATEFAYDSRGLRFIQYDIDGQDYYAVRFSQIQ
jgi:hypothetical protein